MNRKDFTLIELLVVVAIIGVLVTILMPSLHKARKKAEVAVCISNHKQLATAYHLYSNTNGGNAPAHTWYRDFIGKIGKKGWGNKLGNNRPLNQFANAAEVAHCPGDKGEPPNPTYNWSTHNFTQYGNSYYVTYATWANIRKSTNVGTSGIMPEKFDNPTKKIMFYVDILNGAKQWNHPKAKRHDDRFARYPVSFIDGHAEFFRFSWKETPKYNPNGNMDYMIDNWGYY